MQNGGIEITVAGSVPTGSGICLANAAGAMDEHFFKTPATRPILRFVAQMPFPENAGVITGAMEDLGQGGGFARETFSFENRMSNAVFELVSAGHQGATRRRAGRADVK